MRQINEVQPRITNVIHWAINNWTEDNCTQSTRSPDVSRQSQLGSTCSLQTFQRGQHWLYLQYVVLRLVVTHIVFHSVKAWSLSFSKNSTRWRGTISESSSQLCRWHTLKKLAWKIWRKFVTAYCSKTTLQPITLHGSCHVPDSFCDGIELCSIPCKKLVSEKTGTRLTDTRVSFWYKFPEQVSLALLRAQAIHNSVTEKWVTCRNGSVTAAVGRLNNPVTAELWDEETAVVAVAWRSFVTAACNAGPR